MGKRLGLFLLIPPKKFWELEGSVTPWVLQKITIAFYGLVKVRLDLMIAPQG